MKNLKCTECNYCTYITGNLNKHITRMHSKSIDNKNKSAHDSVGTTNDNAVVDIQIIKQETYPTICTKQRIDNRAPLWRASKQVKLEFANNNKTKQTYTYFTDMPVKITGGF